jgi:hypothetical protein
LQTNALIVVRYTRDTFRDLFPAVSDNEWEYRNSPNDIASFVKNSIDTSKSTCATKTCCAIIATIDNKYLEWLKIKKRNHSTKSLAKYIKQHVDDIPFWNERLMKSGMTTTYNILGIPSLIILHDLDGASSQYSLSKKTTDEISQLLKTIYKSHEVFVPGWILKGCDMPSCTQDIAQLAELFWKDGTRVRLGKYLEQRYNQNEIADKFSPLYFVVPFVVKAQITNAIINLDDIRFAEGDYTNQSMESIKFKKQERFDLFKIIYNSIPQVISIGINAVMPGHAYKTYQINAIKRCRESSNGTAYW